MHDLRISKLKNKFKSDDFNSKISCNRKIRSKNSRFIKNQNELNFFCGAVIIII